MDLDNVIYPCKNKCCVDRFALQAHERMKSCHISVVIVLPLLAQESNSAPNRHGGIGTCFVFGSSILGHNFLMVLVTILKGLDG